MKFLPARITLARRGVAATLAAAALAALLGACAGGRPAGAPASPPGGREAAPARAAPVEVDEYKGQRLDSALAFRENSIKGPQTVDRASYRLSVGGLVERGLSLGYEELLALPRVEKVVTLNCVEGWSATVLWEGFRVEELLSRAGAYPNATTLILFAVDGYSTTIPLADARERDMILALRMNGLELAPERGFPLQLVAEDKWGYKWIKWIDRIELSVEADYRGYWEERGYSVDGDHDGPVWDQAPYVEDKLRL